MEHEHRPNSATSPAPATPAAANIPLELGGSAVTGFSGAGISVQLESPKDKAAASIAEFTLAALQRGIQTGRVSSPGRTQFPE